MYSGCYGPDRASLVFSIVAILYNSLIQFLNESIFKSLRFRGGKFGRAPPLLYPRSSFKQVEKTLEMKKWSRNGKVIKQGRNVYDVSQCSTCSMVIYLTIQYQGGCGYIEGHAYCILFVHNETCVLGFHVYNSLMHPRKHHFKIL